MKLKSSQRGASLVFVLVLSLIVTAIGTMAIRQSVTSLNIATSGQVQALLQQASDSALYRIQDPKFLEAFNSGAGALGFAREKQNFDKELVFCVRESDPLFFNVDLTSVIYVPPGTNSIKNDYYSTEGYCDPADDDSFTSKRKAVMTQISVMNQASTSSIPLGDFTIGTDKSNNNLDDNTAFSVYAISILPNLSDASSSEIKGCLSGRMNQAPANVVASQKNSVTDCLSALNVPYSTQVVDFKYYIVGFAN